MNIIKCVLLFILITSFKLHSEVLVVFGATGDLTKRKLIPALINLYKHHQLDEDFTFIGIGRREISQSQFCDDISNFVSHGDKVIWNEFKEKVIYLQGSFDQDEIYKKLKDRLENKKNFFYLATPQSSFSPIVKKLHSHQLLTDARIIIEKPFGKDLDSARQLQKELYQHLEWKQIYLIDHYLGKEMVNNVLSLRFDNPILNSVWDYQHIDNVEITISEDIGIESRGSFWEETGLLRDMFQSHMMQVLSLIAMDKPISYSESDIRNEKVKILKAIRSFPLDNINNYIVRGQYDSYRKEKDVAANSNVETFVAAKIFIDNERWFNVPFILKAGKKLSKRFAEVVINFKLANQLILRIQPQEEIALVLNVPVPGYVHEVKKEELVFSLREKYQDSIREAYERLLGQALKDDHTSFVCCDEHLLTWGLFTPILNHWAQNPPSNFPNYMSGSEGPDLAILKN